MNLNDVVQKIRENNERLNHIEQSLSDEEKVALLLEEYDEVKKSKLIEVIEREKLRLVIKGLNLAIKKLEGDRELDGTYWGAGWDYDYAKVRGVIRFLSEDYREDAREYGERLGLEMISHDLLKGVHAFTQESQNFALQKTFGYTNNPAYMRLWEDMIYTLQHGSLIITTDFVPSKIGNEVVRIEDSLSGFNGLKLRWLIAPVFSTYRPDKFDFYRKR